MTIYMGYAKNKGKCHFIDVQTGFERKAFCGAMIHRFVCKYGTDEPVPYADHWRDRYSNCSHCEGLLRD